MIFDLLNAALFDLRRCKGGVCGYYYLVIRSFGSSRTKHRPRTTSGSRQEDRAASKGCECGSVARKTSLAECRVLARIQGARDCRYPIHALHRLLLMHHVRSTSGLCTPQASNLPVSTSLPEAIVPAPSPSGGEAIPVTALSQRARRSTTGQQSEGVIIDCHGRSSQCQHSPYAVSLTRAFKIGNTQVQCSWAVSQRTDCGSQSFERRQGRATDRERPGPVYQPGMP